MTNDYKIIDDALHLDNQIIRLIQKKIKLIKKASKNNSNLVLELRKIHSNLNNDQINKELMTDFFENLYDQAINEKNIKVAFLGPFATNSHQAALKIFGESATYFPQTTIYDIFQTVEQSQASFGVVPIENSIEGAINSTLDFLKESNLSIFGEETLLISHNLISYGNIQDIKEVYSHPQILGQCRMWLQKNIPNALQIETSSSAQAVSTIKKSKIKAAIGTHLSAKLIKTPIIAEHIQDYKSNKTRFLILSHQKRKKRKKNKTSLVFLCHDKPGSLVEALKIFKRYKINLTKIESRPSKRKDWEYYFYIDLLGHQSDVNIVKALTLLSSSTIFMKVLGSYPIALNDSILPFNPIT